MSGKYISLVLQEDKSGVEEIQGTDYPNLMFVHGQIPTEAPQKTFEAENEDDDYDEFDDDFDVDDYENLDFDENWN